MSLILILLKHANQQLQMYTRGNQRANKHLLTMKSLYTVTWVTTTQDKNMNVNTSVTTFKSNWASE